MDEFESILYNWYQSTGARGVAGLFSLLNIDVFSEYKCACVCKNYYLVTDIKLIFLFISIDERVKLN